jgi:hypothetical protein
VVVDGALVLAGVLGALEGALCVLADVLGALEGVLCVLTGVLFCALAGNSDNANSIAQLIASFFIMFFVLLLTLTKRIPCTSETSFFNVQF